MLLYSCIKLHSVQLVIQTVLYCVWILLLIWKIARSHLITRMHGSAIRSVRSHDQSRPLYGETENSTPSRKYKMATKIFKRRPEYMITSRSWIVVQNRSKINSTNFAGKIGEVSLLTHTLSQSAKQILSSRLQITNIERSETFMAQNAWFHAQMCFSLMTDYV